MEIETEVSDTVIKTTSNNNDQIKPSTSGNNSRLGLCEVCALHAAKYNCPKCELKTCSLRCIKIHKLEIDCDGERNRTKFIPLNQFTNLDLSSDYRLLEEISRTVETSRKKFGRVHRHLPVSLIKLGKAAVSRNTILKFLPKKFVRRRNNSTYLNFKNNTIYWHIEWIFVNADGFKINDKCVDENEKLSTIINRYLVKQEDPVVQEKLQFYQSANLSGIKLFLKAEQKAGKKFYELDHSETLKECLRKKIIIEYPTIHVILKNHEFAYDVIDSDDESMEDISKRKSGKAIVSSIINTAENEDSFYRSLKNLLFISEYSDEELSGDE